MNRTMTVRVSDTWSSPLPVYGGVPQGSILGVMLFNVATDDLEDEEGRTGGALSTRHRLLAHPAVEVPWIRRRPSSPQQRNVGPPL